MSRALTSTELAYERSANQASALFLAFPESHTLFAAQVNGTPGSLDQVVQIAYHNVSAGSYGAIPAMSTLWVGSAAGLYNKGIARIRKAADATYIYIGETSSIAFADGDYLTVVDDFLPWVRVRRNKTNDPITLYMDWDIDFSDQYTSPNPVANAGPDAVINTPNGVIGGGNPASIGFSASGSFMPDGSGISSHSWVALGSGISITNPTTATPTMTVTQTGTWKISDIVTGANGKTTTTWRTLVAFDQTHPPINQFNLVQDPTCDRDNNGGWNFTVRMYDQAAFANVKDRQQVILFAHDWCGAQISIVSSGISFNASTHTISAASGLGVFTTGADIQITGSAHNDGLYTTKTGGVATAIVVNENLIDETAGASITIKVLNGITEISLGPIAGRENVICEGWIDKQSMHYDPNGAYVDFTVQSMAYWINQETMFMLGIEDDDSASDDWHKIHHMTWDFGLFSVLYWQTTLCFISDYFPTGDGRAIPAMSEQEGSIWAQLKSSAWNNLLAIPCCNRYGQLYYFVPPELVPSGSRSGIPIVMTVTKADTELGKMDIPREPQPKTGFLAGLGLQYAWDSSGIGKAVLAYSPGISYKQFGASDALPRIAVPDQATLNTANALYIARTNNNYPNVPISLAQNNRFIDCAPGQFLYVERPATDNPRSLEFASNVIPKTVSLHFDAKLGFMTCIVTAYAETFEDLAVTGVVPVAGGTPIVLPPYAPLPFPTISIPNFPGLPSFPVPPTYPGQPGTPGYPPAPYIPQPPSQYPTCPDAVNGPYTFPWGPNFILQSDPTLPDSDRSAYIHFPCAVRSSDLMGYYINRTTLLFDMNDVYGVNAPTTRVYAVDAFNVRLEEAVVSVVSVDGTTFHMQAVFTATMSSNLAVAGFEVRILPGYSIAGPAIAPWTPTNPPAGLFGFGDFITYGGVHGNSLFSVPFTRTQIQQNYIWYHFVLEMQVLGSLPSSNPNVQLQGMSDVLVGSTPCHWHSFISATSTNPVSVQISGLPGNTDPAPATIGPSGAYQVDQDSAIANLSSNYTSHWFGPILVQQAIVSPQTALVDVTIIVIAGDGTPTPMLVTVGNVSVFNIC